MMMIPIVFSTDHNYVMPTGVTIASLLLSRKEEEYDIYVLISPDVTENDRSLLKLQVNSVSEISRISFIEMKDQFEGGYEIRGISKACYYRLMIPWLLPDLDKIIYMDVDIIIKTSLKELYDTDIIGKYVAGSKPYVWIGMAKYFSKIGLDHTKYINSGVLLINSKLQREHRLNEVYEKLSKKKFIYQDQDIINLACKDYITYFDQRFNLLPEFFGTSEKLSRDVAIHYAGDKPWKYFTYAWSEWWNIYNQSIFKEIGFCHKVTKNILSYKTQFNKLKKQAKGKFQQYFAKLGWH